MLSFLDDWKIFARPYENIIKNSLFEPYTQINNYYFLFSIFS